MLDGIAIKVCPFMEPNARPVLIDGTLKVSETIWSLMKSANEDELRHLCENIFPIKMRDPFQIDPDADEFKDHESMLVMAHEFKKIMGRYKL